MPVKVYEVVFPAERPSTFTSEMEYPEAGVILYVLLPPEGTAAVPCGDIDPPLFEDAAMENAEAWNEAVAVTLLFIATVHVGLVSKHAPDQPVKVEFAFGAAVRVTEVPRAKVVPLGFVVTVPPPVPDVVTERV